MPSAGVEVSSADEAEVAAVTALAEGPGADEIDIVQVGEYLAEESH